MTAHESLRVQIAEAMGWARIDKPVFENGMEEVGALGMTSLTRRFWDIDQLPDYPHSLDCCADFEATLKGNAHPSAVTDDERAYRDELAKLMGCAWYQSAQLIFATPLQRCLAFAKVRGLTVQP